MLDWLSAKSQDTSDHSHEEPPETPAHLFAVKAFKSAFFGTPAPPPQSSIDNTDQELGATRHEKSSKGINLPKRRLTAPSNLQAAPSPAKGILLTPGTMGARRKTVSFERLSGQKDLEPEERRTSAPDARLNETNATSQSVDENAVRRNLFTKKEITDAKTAQNADARKVPTAGPPTKSAGSDSDPDAKEDSGADVTIDLAQPRSVSGQHWKDAYTREHTISKQEMKKLIRWNQNAKERADRKDRETMRLRDRLQKSENRIKDLEGQMSKQAQEAQAEKPLTAHDAGHPGRERPSQDPQIARLEKVAKDAQDKARKLERENDNFKRTILRVKEEMAKYESRHKEWIDKHKRKDERHAEQRKELKSKIILQKEASAGHIREIEEEAAAERARLLRKIEFLRSEVTSATPAKFAVQANTKSKAKDEGVPPHGKPSSKSKSQQLKQQETIDYGASSPTILDSHLAKARGSTPRSSVIEKQVPKARSTTTEGNASGRPASAAAPSRTSAKPIDLESADEDEPELPTLTAHGTTRHARPIAVRTRKAVRVKHRPSVGMTPEREAAARRRIALRSAEKQRDTRFLFGKEKEDRLPLLDRLANV